MKLKLFLILSVVTGLELIARGPRVLSDKEKAALIEKKAALIEKKAARIEQRASDSLDCEKEATTRAYGYSPGKYDDCMRRKHWL